MAYNNAIPAANDQLSQSQQDILNNFIEIQNAFNTDHTVFNDPEQGKHDKVRMPVQAAPPAFTVGETALWNEQDATTTKNEMHIRKQNQAGDVSIPFSASVLSNVATPIGNVGWTYLPSGILIKWGTATTAGAAPNTVNVNTGTPQAGPSMTEMFTVFLQSRTQIAGSSGNLIATVGIPSFSVSFTAAGINFYWVAIGR